MVIFQDASCGDHGFMDKRVCSLVACFCVMVFDNGELFSLPFILVRTYDLLGTASFGLVLKFSLSY
jgi:hypothetical protein